MNNAMTHSKIENSQIVKVGARPRWFNDGGEPLTPEQWLLFGYYPNVHDRPDHDPLLQRLVQKPKSEWLIESDHVVVTYEVVDIPLEEAIETARQAAYDRINSEYETRVTVLAEGYPASEQQSWPVQIQEANIVLGADDEPTPWIDSAAPARGITRVDLANLIKAQDTAYRQYHGALTGIRQALRDQIAAVPDDDPASVAALYEIGWPT